MGGNLMLSRLDKVVHKIAVLTRHAFIEKIREMGEPALLPDNYLKQVDIIASRNPGAIGPFMDERMAVWRKLHL